MRADIHTHAYFMNELGTCMPMCSRASVEIKLGALRCACNVLVIKFDQVRGSDSNADRLIRSGRALVWSLNSQIVHKETGGRTTFSHRSRVSHAKLNDMTNQMETSSFTVCCQLK